MGIEEAIEAEAQAQAICMLTQDFRARLRRVRRQAQAGLRGQLMHDAADSDAARLPRLAVLRRPASRLRRRGSTLGRVGALAASDHARRRRRLPRARARARRGGLARRMRSRGLRRRRADAIDTRASASPARRWRATTGLADFAFAMQGLGSGAITPRRQRRAEARATCRAWPRGEAIAAFALSEPDAGSDVAAMACAARERRRRTTCSTARRPGSPTAASPTSTSCSPAPAKRRARAASPPSSSTPARPGFEIAERIDVIAPHPLARLRFDELPRAADQRIGARRRGLQGRDAHARRLPRLGRRRRARLRAARASTRRCARATTRTMFGATLADFQLTQAKLGEMATAIDAAALLTYRAAWQRDQGRRRHARGGDGQDDRHREARSR